MTTLVIEDNLAEELQTLAQRENRALSEVLRSMIENYRSLSHPVSAASSEDALDAMRGMFDDDITDLSTTVRETMEAYYREKYGRSD